MVLGFILSLEKDKKIKTKKNYARINPQQRQSQMVASVIIARVKTSENEPSNQDICTTWLDVSKKVVLVIIIIIYNDIFVYIWSMYDVMIAPRQTGSE